MNMTYQFGYFAQLLAGNVHCTLFTSFGWVVDLNPTVTAKPNLRMYIYKGHLYIHTCRRKDEVSGERVQVIRRGICEFTPPGWHDNRVYKQCNNHHKPLVIEVYTPVLLGPRTEWLPGSTNQLPV